MPMITILNSKCFATPQVRIPPAAASRPPGKPQIVRRVEHAAENVHAAHMASIPITASVISAVAAACNVEPMSIPLDANVLDLGVDSLVLLSIVSRIAMEHGVTLTDDQTLELFEAESLHELIAKLHVAVRKSELFGHEENDSAP